MDKSTKRLDRDTRHYHPEEVLGPTAEELEQWLDNARARRARTAAMQALIAENRRIKAARGGYPLMLTAEVARLCAVIHPGWGRLSAKGR